MDENEYADLPDDPEEAFAILHRKRSEEFDPQSQDSSEEEKYCVDMIAFDEVYNLNLLTQFNDFIFNDSGEINWNEFRKMKRYCDFLSAKILMDSARRNKRHVTPIVVFDTAQKSAIHHLVQKIRDRLNEASLEEKLRESLFDKLNAFAAEVDRSRTRTESWNEFFVDFSRTARQVNDEIKPLQQTIDKITDYIEKGKKYIESLPRWSERKKIEAPKEQLPAPPKGSEMDDEIPF